MSNNFWTGVCVGCVGLMFIALSAIGLAVLIDGKF